ncbi:MAG TPA: stage V sporulation protein AC [Clostridia bacterium]|nr:stage V sporulation protein AC [Clostridia bacterium]
MNEQKSKRQMQLEQDYKKLVERITPNSAMAINLVKAYVIGGLICMFGQGVSDLGKLWFNLDTQQAATYTAIVMVFLGAFLTGIGIYDDLGKVAGAGSIVPITGFANSIVSAAMEYKREGYVLGVGAKMFTIAGPVLVYGIGTSVVVGIIAYIVGG